MTSRAYIAAALAPLAGAVAAGLGFVATGALVLGAKLPAADYPGTAAHWLGFYLAFGLPLAYFAELVATLAYRVVRESAGPPLGTAIAGAATLGGCLSLVSGRRSSAPSSDCYSCRPVSLAAQSRARCSGPSAFGFGGAVPSNVALQLTSE